jgi:hypothetical protein
MSDPIRTPHRIPTWRIAALAFSIVAAQACASSPPPSGPSYAEQLSRWEGGNEADLVSSWGMPQKTHVLADGGRVIEYGRKGADEAPCTTRFTLDKSGTVVRWWYAGVGCPASKAE